jgi:hypothetical protein
LICALAEAMPSGYQLAGNAAVKQELNLFATTAEVEAIAVLEAHYPRHIPFGIMVLDPASQFQIL